MIGCKNCNIELIEEDDLDSMLCMACYVEFEDEDHKLESYMEKRNDLD